MASRGALTKAAVVSCGGYRRFPVKLLWGGRRVAFSLLAYFSFFAIHETSRIACAGIWNMVTDMAGWAYHGLRDSETLENLRANATYMLSAERSGGPPLSVLLSEVDGLGRGAGCLLDVSRSLAPNQSDYLLAVAAKADGAARFVNKFKGASPAAQGLSLNMAVSLLRRQKELLSGAVPLPTTQGLADFLAGEVSTIRPAIFALSHSYARSLTTRDSESVAVFVRTVLPVMQEYLRRLLHLMEGHQTAAAVRKRRVLSTWIFLWFAQDVALLSACPNADRAEVEARRQILHLHQSASKSAPWAGVRGEAGRAGMGAPWLGERGEVGSAATSAPWQGGSGEVERPVTTGPWGAPHG